MSELTNAMGIGRPSLYACFGNKDALFIKALDLYEREKLAYMQTALEAGSARGVAERLLRGALEVQRGSCNPKGCLDVISSVASSLECESIRADIAARRASSKAALIRRFERARSDTDLDPTFKPEALANYLIALAQGLSVQAAAGTSYEDLEQMVEAVLLIWPTS